VRGLRREGEGEKGAGAAVFREKGRQPMRLSEIEVKMKRYWTS